MVMLARPLLADPEWPNKAYAGRVDEIVPCIGDQEGCLNEFVEGGHPQCSVNPRTGFEDVCRPTAAGRAAAPRGRGGRRPSGIACACAAARRGHAVTVFERADRPGGMLVPGSVPRAKLDVANYLALPGGAAGAHRARDTAWSCGWGHAASAGQLAGRGLRHGRDLHRRRATRPPSTASTARNVVSAVDLLPQPGLAAGARASSWSAAGRWAARSPSGWPRSTASR